MFGQGAFFFFLFFVLFFSFFWCFFFFGTNNFSLCSLSILKCVLKIQHLLRHVAVSTQKIIAQRFVLNIQSENGDTRFIVLHYMHHSFFFLFDLRFFRLIVIMMYFKICLENPASRLTRDSFNQLKLLWITAKCAVVDTQYDNDDIRFDVSSFVLSV